MNFDDLLRKFRNKLRNLDKQQLIILATNKLHEVEGLPPHLMQGAYPWYILLLIRWSFELENKYSYYPREVTYGNFVELMKIIHDMEAITQRMFLTEGPVYGIPKLLRSIAFHQFWLQNSRGSWDLARQLFIFNNLREQHPISEYFYAQTGITIEDFLILSSMVWVWSSQNRSHIHFTSEALFANTTYNKTTIDAYLRLLSRTRKEMKEYIITRKQGVKNPFLQFSEQTPLVRYPFLKIDRNYLLFSRRVLEETISAIPYDILKASDNSNLINQFAYIFEQYVEKCLSAVFSEYYTEADLKSNFPGKKVTDFLLSLEQCTVLLEVKAIDLRSSVKVILIIKV